MPADERLAVRNERHCSAIRVRRAVALYRGKTRLFSQIKQFVCSALEHRHMKWKYVLTGRLYEDLADVRLPGAALPMA